MHQAPTQQENTTCTTENLAAAIVAVVLFSQERFWKKCLQTSDSLNQHYEECEESKQWSMGGVELPQQSAQFFGTYTAQLINNEKK